MVDDGVMDASHCLFNDDDLVNLYFSLTHSNRYFEDDRFEDILVEDNGFHRFKDAHFSYNDDDVGMDCLKLVEEPIHDCFDKGSLNFEDIERRTFDTYPDLVYPHSFPLRII